MKKDILKGVITPSLVLRSKTVFATSITGTHTKAFKEENNNSSSMYCPCEHREFYFHSCLYDETVHDNFTQSVRLRSDFSSKAFLQRYYLYIGDIHIPIHFISLCYGNVTLGWRYLNATMKGICWTEMAGFWFANVPCLRYRLWNYRRIQLECHIW